MNLQENGISDKRHWCVIQTQGRQEDKAKTAPARQGLKTFLPRGTYLSRRRDRKFIPKAPLFSGYLFIHAELSPATFQQIIKGDGVVRFKSKNAPDWGAKEN